MPRCLGASMPRCLDALMSLFVFVHHHHHASRRSNNRSPNALVLPRPQQTHSAQRATNAGLANVAAFFKKESGEERHHAEMLMEYQVKRGGVVKLETIMPPHTEFDHPEKGDALYAFELALSLEKLNFQKLRHLHEVAEKHGDSQMCDFIEGGLLADQMESVYEVAEKVAQLRRVGKGLGVYVFDQELAVGQ